MIAMARTLFILNDAPYGTERSYNGLRLAGARTSAHNPFTGPDAR